MYKKASLGFVEADISRDKMDNELLARRCKECDTVLSVDTSPSRECNEAGQCKGGVLMC